jgi:hypothetical protein
MTLMSSALVAHGRETLRSPKIGSEMMRKSETRTETLQGASAEAWFGMHSVKAQKAVINVLNYGALKKKSAVRGIRNQWAHL